MHASKQTNRVGNVCFALIKFFVQIKQDETHNLALGHPLNFINHDESCHITHVHVNKTAFVAVPLQNISDQCIYIDLGSDCYVIVHPNRLESD